MCFSLKVPNRQVRESGEGGSKYRGLKLPWHSQPHKGRCVVRKKWLLSRRQCGIKPKSSRTIPTQSPHVNTRPNPRRPGGGMPRRTRPRSGAMNREVPTGLPPPGPCLLRRLPPAEALLLRPPPPPRLLGDLARRLSGHGAAALAAPWKGSGGGAPWFQRPSRFRAGASVEPPRGAAPLGPLGPLHVGRSGPRFPSRLAGPRRPGPPRRGGLRAGRRTAGPYSWFRLCARAAKYLSSATADAQGAARHRAGGGGRQGHAHDKRAERRPLPRTPLGAAAVVARGNGTGNRQNFIAKKNLWRFQKNTN